MVKKDFGSNYYLVEFESGEKRVFMSTQHLRHQKDADETLAASQVLENDVILAKLDANYQIATVKKIQREPFDQRASDAVVQTKKKVKERKREKKKIDIRNKKINIRNKK